MPWHTFHCTIITKVPIKIKQINPKYLVLIKPILCGIVCKLKSSKSKSLISNGKIKTNTNKKRSRRKKRNSIEKIDFDSINGKTTVVIAQTKEMIYIFIPLIFLKLVIFSNGIS